MTAKKQRVAREESGRREDTAPTFLATLPDEILLKIFRLLGPRTIARLGSLCSSFLRVSRDPSLWRTVDIDHLLVIPDNTTHARPPPSLFFAPHVQSMKVQQASLLGRLQLPLSFPSLQSLHFDGQCLVVGYTMHAAQSERKEHLLSALKGLTQLCSVSVTFKQLGVWTELPVGAGLVRICGLNIAFHVLKGLCTRCPMLEELRTSCPCYSGELEGDTIGLFSRLSRLRILLLRVGYDEGDSSPQLV